MTITQAQEGHLAICLLLQFQTGPHSNTFHIHSVKKPINNHMNCTLNPANKWHESCIVYWIGNTECRCDKWRYKCYEMMRKWARNKKRKKTIDWWVVDTVYIQIVGTVRNIILDLHSFSSMVQKHDHNYSLTLLQQEWPHTILDEKTKIKIKALYTKYWRSQWRGT